jgi:site-specific recombinase XerD
MQARANTERLALAGFLAGYSGLTREAYALDLRQFASWCHQHHLRLFGARRADIECFARDLEARGRARATVGPHTLRYAFIIAALDAGVPLRDVQEAASHADPGTTMRYDRARASLDRHGHLHRRRLHRRSGEITPTSRLPPAWPSATG